MAADIRLVVGLGNPGARYAAHRHNIGFRVVEALAAHRGLAFQAGTGPWAGATSDSLVLLKPLTYMNLSGEAVVDWSERTGIPVTGAEALSGADPGAEPGPAPLRPLVVCDDLALPLGAVRLRARGGSGGQNGLASLIDRLGGEAFPRLRLGIAPAGAEVPPEAWADYVLTEFGPEELETVADTVTHAVAALEWWLAHGLEAAASRFNRRGGAAETGA